MATAPKTLKTANTSGYTVALDGECTRVVVGCRSGEAWVQPVQRGGTSTAPGSSPAPANAGDVADYAHLGGAGESKEFDLSSGFAERNQGRAYTHIRVWSVSAGEIEILGA